MRALWLLAAAFAVVADAAPVKRFEWPGDAQKRKLRAEIREAGPGHPWAGEYYEGDGLGMNLYLMLSPKGSYYFSRSGCTGSGPSEEGKIRQTGSVLRFEGAKSYWLEQEFHVVNWGERAYLLKKDEIVSFANYVNRGWEPRYGAHGVFLMRHGPGFPLASGRPKLPKEYEKLLLDRVVDASVVAVGAVKSTSTESWKPEQRTTVVELDAGSQDGLSPGLELPLRGGADGNATIVAVQERTSTAELTSTTTPRIGWRVSTRYDDSRELAPPERPYLIKTIKTSPKTFSPIQTDPRVLSGEEPFAGAAESGFDVVETARIEVSLATRDLLMGEHMDKKIAEAARAAGANAYRMTMYYIPKLEDERPGPYPIVMTIPAYRVEFRGRPLEKLDFNFSCGGKETCKPWEVARASLLVNASKYEIERRKIYADSKCKVLGLSARQCAGWSTLEVESLSPEQQTKLRNYWDLGVNEGLVRELEPLYEAGWQRDLDREFEARIKPVQERDPRAYDEYLMLKEELARIREF